MTASTALRTVLAIGAGFVAGVLATLLSVSDPSWRKSTLSPERGSRLFDPDVAEVRVLAFHTDASVLVAQRSRPGAPFATQITYADGRNPQHCLSTPELAGVLQILAQAKVVGLLDHKERMAKYPQALGRLEFQDAVFGEPISPWLLYGRDEGDSIAIERQGANLETNIPQKTLKTLTSGCATLGKP